MVFQDGGGYRYATTMFDNLIHKGPRRVSPLSVPMLMPNAPAANMSLYVGARAAVNTPVSACASGNEGIALALDQIRLGRADVVLAGGTAVPAQFPDGSERCHPSRPAPPHQLRLR